MEFGLVQVVRYFEHHRNLRSQGAGAANILREMPVSSRRSSTPNMPSTLPSAPSSGTASNCRAWYWAMTVQIRAGLLSEIVGPEDFFGAQGAGGDALGKTCIHALRLAPIDGYSEREIVRLPAGR